MSDLRQWQANNDRHLSAVLTWLRLLLGRAIKAAPPGKPAAATTEEESSWWFGRHRHAGDESAPAAEKAPDDELTKAARTMADAAKVDPPPAIAILGQRLGLSRFEHEVLLLCAAMELDTRIPGLCAQAQNDTCRPYPTFALALTLFDDPSWDALSADRPLRYWRLIEINQPGATPLTLSALRADERIVNYLKGLNQLDDRLAPLLAPFHVSGEGAIHLAASHQAVADAVEHAIQSAAADGGPPVIQLTGTDPVGKQQVALQVLSRLGLQGFRLPGEVLPPTAGELETFARLWHRESTLLPLALYVEAQDGDNDARPAEGRLRLNRFIARCNALTFLDTREPRQGLGLDAPSFEVDKPTAAEQATAWKEALGESAAESPEQLAGQFNLNLPAIRRIASAVLTAGPPGDPPAGMLNRLWDACLSRTRPRLDRLAQRIVPKAAWNDLVLPVEPLKLLHEISEQARQRNKVYDEWGFRRKMSRGFGISALFAGESGTGKTMAAEVIANELRLDLYRIDLSAVVSKYIGETEKNLRRVFDAAEDGGVILFFDEADALFGKRSEVKDSHDRYANIEVNYLLQRMEAFQGLAILATNMKSALDAAFMRRLRFIVNIPFPGPAERKRIWEGAFPRDDEERNLTGTPVEELDCDQLSRLNLTGGSIHNVALNAAFLAARTGSAVTMQLVFEAARSEFRKLEKPVNEGDFRSLKPVGAKL
jgi:ATPase family associated with various cellular activities (AAA)/Winged helix domain, variant